MINSADAETLIVQLQRNAGGHAHTAGKAQNYLRMIADKPDAKFSNCTADEFVALVKNAAYRGEWDKLRYKMTHWW